MRPAASTPPWCAPGPTSTTPPQTVAGAYLRLHALSHRLARPNTVNLDGIFSRLPNVVWTSAGPCRTEDFETTRMRLRAAVGRPIQVHSVDKFPRMTDYVLPSGVRIGNGANVRLGAYLSEGTTSCTPASSTTTPGH